jgi:hypothetical protein
MSQTVCRPVVIIRSSFSPVFTFTLQQYQTYIAVKQGRRKQSNFPTTTMVVVYLHLVEEVGLAVLGAEHLITG